jgi:hypothetical protein
MNLGIGLRSAQAFGARSQAPEQSKSRPMPGDNGFWFNDDQGFGPARPEPTEQNPKYSVLDSEPRARMLSLQYAQLLT